eukprot:TRINITY_DN12591_c0_g1_i2.p1 TRINITY_DN12591_c0_g1~~TRINITY_DN12591_c0_g1_i2.p1  ORF type:complete len:804 (-),score=190.60 TRINITY_DN12591_c0_g1_i2:72-2483(-)
MLAQSPKMTGIPGAVSTPGGGSSSATGAAADFTGLFAHGREISSRLSRHSDDSGSLAPADDGMPVTRQALRQELKGDTLKSTLSTFSKQIVQEVCAELEKRSPPHGVAGLAAGLGALPLQLPGLLQPLATPREGAGGPMSMQPPPTPQAVGAQYANVWANRPIKSYMARELYNAQEDEEAWLDTLLKEEDEDINAGTSTMGTMFGFLEQSATKALRKSATPGSGDSASHQPQRVQFDENGDEIERDEDTDSEQSSTGHRERTRFGDSLQKSMGTMAAAVEGVVDTSVSRGVRVTNFMEDKVKELAPNLEQIENAWGIQGHGAKRGNIHTAGHARGCRALMARFVRHTAFECITLVVIFANVLLVGYTVDWNARYGENEKEPDVFRALDIFMCVFFTLELSVRCFVYRSHFFCMFGWAWNWFDAFLVLLQLFEEVVLFLNDSKGMANFGVPSTVMRIVRILRAVRVMRVLRLMRFAEDLQLLVSCILHSLKSFLWAFLLIVMEVYVVGIYLTQASTLARDSHDLSAAGIEDLNRWYGTVPRSAVSLFQALTGGVDWNDITEPLFDHVGLFAGFGTMFFIAFSILAVLNIVTGTFVSRSMERAEEVRTIHGVSQARKLFATLDDDNSGCITYGEIDEQLESPAVKDFFRSLDVDVSEAKCLFQVLDLDGSGTIEFEEFMDACMRLQGPARAVDLMTFVRETRTAFYMTQATLIAQQNLLVSLTSQYMLVMERMGLEVPPEDNSPENHPLRKAAQDLEKQTPFTPKTLKAACEQPSISSKSLPAVSLPLVPQRTRTMPLRGSSPRP